MKNTETIEKFYTAFQQKDAAKMVSCYHDDVVFQDPAFGTLFGIEAKAMWQMLLSNATDLQITYTNVHCSNQAGSAHWEAKYTFSKTGRKVYNKIDASFKFKDGLIIDHRDHFNFWKWSSMALGPTGLLLGFTFIVKKKVRSSAREALKAYCNKNRKNVQNI